MSQELNVQVESPSNITRKLTITVPAARVSNRVQNGLASAQRSANIKGFRKGHVPITVVEKYYGADIRHQVFHDLIDESFQEAIRTKKIVAVGRPAIETPKHKTGDGAHDHTLNEGQDLTYTATVEVLPELEPKGYTGVSLKREKVDVSEADVEVELKQLQEGHAELVPVGGGLVLADGSSSSRPVRKGDHADLTFSGGILVAGGREDLPGMKGSRVVEIGSGSLIPGFEEAVEGMRSGETKTFKVTFPAEYHEAKIAGKDAEFTVTVNELKEKKVPALDDEFAKHLKFDSFTELKTKVREQMTARRERDSESKLRSDLLVALIEKNTFDCPQALIEAQTRSLVNELAQQLKQYGFGDDQIKNELTGELENLRKKADSQVRASLILEAIAKKEKIEVTKDELDAEITKVAAGTKIGEAELREYYTKNPSRLENLEFQVKEERVIQFLLGKAKIK